MGIITREQFKKAAEKAGDWKIKFTREELDIIGLWLAGKNEQEIADEIKRPISRVKRKIHGCDGRRSGSIYRSVISIGAALKNKNK